MSKLNIKQVNGSIINTGNGLTFSQHEALRQLIHLSDGIGGPFEGFTSGAFRVQDSNILPVSITWYTDSTQTKKILTKQITYLENTNPSTIEWIVYDIDGITTLADVIDTINYSGMFEINRTRTINNYTSSNNILTANTHESVRQLIHLADGVGGPFEGFLSGAFRATYPLGSPFPTSITWYNDNTKTKKIIEKNISYTSNKFPYIISWTLYSGDGITQLMTTSDYIVYDGIFESYRTRVLT